MTRQPLLLLLQLLQQQPLLLQLLTTKTSSSLLFLLLLFFQMMILLTTNHQKAIVVLSFQQQHTRIIRSRILSSSSSSLLLLLKTTNNNNRRTFYYNDDTTNSLLLLSSSSSQQQQQQQQQQRYYHLRNYCCWNKNHNNHFQWNSCNNSFRRRQQKMMTSSSSSSSSSLLQQRNNEKSILLSSSSSISTSSISKSSSLSLLFSSQSDLEHYRNQKDDSIITNEDSQDENTKNNTKNRIIMIEEFYNNIKNEKNNTSLYNIIQQSIQLLEYCNVLEPIHSTIHLLSYAMNLSWENGYKELFEYYNNNNNNNNNNNCNLQISSRINNKDDINNNISDNNNNEYSITKEQIQVYQSYISRRINHEPIQYIIGKWDFLNYQIKIRSPLLCPRPETEELVSLIIKDIYNNYNKKKQKLEYDNDSYSIPKRILDIGCGTGCIGIALADQIVESYVTAIDIEPIAILTSNENAANILGTSNNNHHRYIAQLQSIENFTINNNRDIDNNNNNNELFDLVVSNPPYILKSDLISLSPTVIQYESINALSDNNSIDGMNIIRQIIHQLPYICHVNAICWLEVDPIQPKLIQDMLSLSSHNANKNNKNNKSNKSNNNNPIRETKTNSIPKQEPEKIVRYVSTYKDMFGKERFVKLQVVVK